MSKPTKTAAQPKAEPAPFRSMRYYDPIRRVWMVTSPDGPKPEAERSPPASRIDC